MAIASYSELFDVVEEYYNLVTELETTISTLTTLDAALFVDMETADVENLYGSATAAIQDIQSAIGSQINSLSIQLSNFLTDRDYIYENLPTTSFDFNSILDEIYKDMVAQSEDIDRSIILLGGTNADNVSVDRSDAVDDTDPYGRLFVTRLLDGVNAPSSLAISKDFYTTVPSQLMQACDMTCKCISADAIGEETYQLFSDAEFTGPFNRQEEQSGIGPTLNTGLSQNLVALNADFSTFTVTDTPDDWTFNGGVVTSDYAEHADGLNVLDDNWDIRQAITGLTAEQMYCIYAKTKLGTDNDPLTARVSIAVDSTNSDIATGATFTLAESADNNSYFYPYLFFQLADTVDLSDVAVKFEPISVQTTSNFILEEIVLVPVVYYNGLGFAMATGNEVDVVDKVYTMTGSYQTAEKKYSAMFRKLYNRQLPTDTSPTIADPS